MKTVNVGIFAHIDAGKTTLTERLLLEAGVLRTAGSVDGGTSVSDFLPVERRRGISVRDATVTFSYADTTVNLIDTPGHADFLEEAELALAAVDVAVLVLSAREGAEAQTELLYEAISRRSLPVVLFVNKCDMEDVDVKKLVNVVQKIVTRQILICALPTGEAPAEFVENALEAIGDESLLDRYLMGELSERLLRERMIAACAEGKLVPALFGSARTGAGVGKLLELLCSFSFSRDESAPFSAFVYQVERRKSVGKIAHMRIFTGSLDVRGQVLNRRTGSSFKAAQLKQIRGEKYSDAPLLKAGQVGAAAGLADVRAGDFLGAPPPVEPLGISPPYLRVRVVPEREEELNALKSALEELSDESPSLDLVWVPQKRELTVAAAGKVQTEILKETLAERFSLRAEIGAPSVIYRETPARAAYGFEAYTMPKPCWAVVKFLIEPLPRGSGFVYESIAAENRIAHQYREHVKAEVPRVLRQGLKGWQVVDLKVTLVDGESHVQHTHPLDFFTATPMGIMDGLRNAGTILLEPVLSLFLRAPESAMGKLLSELTLRRGKFGVPDCNGETFTLRAELPAEESFGFGELVASLTGGRGSCQARLLGYFPCPEGHGRERERIGVNPLDRARWILHCRGAYK